MAKSQIELKIRDGRAEVVTTQRDRETSGRVTKIHAVSHLGSTHSRERDSRKWNQARPAKDGTSRRQKRRRAVLGLETIYEDAALELQCSVVIQLILELSEGCLTLTLGYRRATSVALA